MIGYRTVKVMRKPIAVLLLILMVAGLIPPATFADLGTSKGNTAAENRAVLQALEQLAGNEVTAETAEKLLGELDLLDENGEPRITAAVDLDGELLTLAEVRQLVFSPEADLGRLVLVDGTPISLADLRLMLAIEDELLRIKQTYLGEVSLTDEQRAALDSLRRQIENDGISVAGFADATPVFPSGIDHDIYIEVTPSATHTNGSGAQSVTVSLKDSSGAVLAVVPGYDITLDYRFVDASASAGTNYTCAATSGTVVFAAGSSETVQNIPFSIVNDSSRWEGQKTFLIQYQAPVRALLQGGQRAAETVVKVDSTYKWLSRPDANRNGWLPFAGELTKSGSFFPELATQGAVDVFEEGLFDTLHVTVGSTSTEGRYQISCYFGNYPVQGEYATISLPELEVYRHAATSAGFTTAAGQQAVQAYRHGQDSLTVEVRPIGDSPRLSEGFYWRFLDTQQPRVTAVHLPTGKPFEYGQSVPIVVEYSEPVQWRSAQLVVNDGEILAPAEAFAWVQPTAPPALREITFLYPVKRVDGASLHVTGVTGATDLYGRAGDPNLGPPNSQSPYSLGTKTATGIIKGVQKADAFGVPVATAALVQGQLQGQISLPLASIPEWLTAEAGANNYLVPSIYASVDGGQTKIDLYANSDQPTALVGSFNPEHNYSGSAVDRIIEFYLDPELDSSSNHQLLIGTYATYSVPPVVFLTDDDFAIAYPQFPADGIVFAEDDTPLQLGYTVSLPTATWAGADDFEWQSDSLAVATISPAGAISLTGTPGTVSFSLTAKNGGVAGRQVTLTSAALDVKAGLTPFLNIPSAANAITIRQSEGAEIRWSSNLIAKNAEESSDTEFTIAVFATDYQSGDLQWDASDPLYSATVTANPDHPLASHVIPPGTLTQVSVIGRYSYVVQVSSPNPVDGQTLTATAYINVLARPAVIRLATLPSYAITDATGHVAIDWALQHFDAENGSQFELTVVDNTTGQLVHIGTETDSGGGSYQLNIPAVAAGLKETYTVAVRAKNVLDPTWSYDSFVLHVYSDAAIRIWVDGSPVGSALVLSNQPAISQMTSDEILALERDIHLEHTLSINHAEHSFGQISDQIQWQSSKSNVASINYRQGSLYENIENFTYVSYRPTTDFILSGLQDGTTEIKATHAATGKEQTMEVQVETLKDKLYLFQVYPRTETSLSYTNGAGTACSVQTDDNGALALYEESGIEGNIHLRSLFDDREYWGTIFRDRLVSSEKDATKLELYPENTLKLREVAKAELYLKQPDGTPYQGDVVLRGGAFKNGAYCPAALLNNQSGEADQVVTLGADGKLTVHMDSTQFWTEESDEVLSPADQLQFIFEARFPGDAYYPQLITVDGNMNQSEVVRLGASVVSLQAASAAEQQKPFVAIQQAQYSNGNPIDTRAYTGNLGLSKNRTWLDINSQVLWWGQGLAVPGERELFLQDQYQGVLPNQNSQTFAYPFSSMLLTKHSFHLDQSLFDEWIPAGEGRRLDLIVVDEAGNQYKQLAMPWQIVNMAGTENVVDSDNLVFLLETCKELSPADASALNLNDGFIGKGIGFMQKLSVESQLFSMVVRPTADPTVFRALIALNLGNMSNDNVTGVYMDDSLNADFDYMPSVMDVHKMINGKYISGQQTIYDYNKDNKLGQRARNISYEIGGYMESEIVYNFAKAEWEILILNGGFNAGGGVSYSWNYNSFVGPIPVTAQLTVGGTAAVSFKAAVQRGEQVLADYGREAINDYLTTLRLYAYVRVFGGIGLDYTVVALKIGLFGQISVDAQFAFLNQPYRSSTATTGQKLLVHGKVGIEFVARYLFFSYERILTSKSFTIADQTFGDWEYIHSLWEEIGKGTPSSSALLLPSGSPVYPLATRAIVERRDYLEQFARSWVSPGQFGVLSLDPQNGVSELETNSYPYSNPVLGHDGQLLLYISDADSTDVQDTEVRWTSRAPGGSYPNGQAVDLTGGGFGDSQLKLASAPNLAAATWVRQTAALQKEAGETATYADIALTSNSTEIMVALYDGSQWITTQLTNNASPDLAPVVATNGRQVLVAWRSVYPADASDPLNFDAVDSVLYRIYDGTSWSAPETMYNGTSGRVMGLEAAMLPDGTAAVAYSIDTRGGQFAIEDSDVVQSGLEVVYAIVGSDGQVKKNVRLTSDSYLDQNPQITTAEFADGSEWFVLGWHSVHDADGVKVNDIRLAAFDKDGTLHSDFIDSVSSAAEYADINISSNFRFAKNAATLSELAILWTEPANAGTVSQDNVLADRDLLRAVKFQSDNGRIYITSALAVAEMPDLTLVDHFDAYAVGDDSVRAVILGTNYGNGYSPSGLRVDAGGEVTDLLLAVKQSNLYTATAQFVNNVEVRSLAVDYPAVVRGMHIPVQFCLFNSGIEPVTSITLQVGDDIAQFDQLYLLPNQSITLIANYHIPSDRVVDPVYTVTATFGAAAGESVTLQDKLHLTIPDVGISKLECLREQDGQRLLQLTLYNQSDVQLSGSDRTVKIGFYSDAAMTTAIPGREPLTITSATDLALIDAGAFTEQVIFDIADFVGAGKEIPPGGVRVFARAWIEQPLPDEISRSGEIMEYYRGNNAQSVLFESLLLASGGKQVSLDVEQTNEQIGGQAVTRAVVTVRNNSLVDVSSGNLIVNLLDDSGNPLESVQSYDRSAGNNGLIELGGEGVTTREFCFVQQGSAVTATYSNAVLADPTNAALSSLSLSGIPFQFSPGVNDYTLTLSGIDAVTVTAVTENPNATVVINGQPAGMGSHRLPLMSGSSNPIVVAVTAADGVTTREYRVIITASHYAVTFNSNGGSDVPAAQVAYNTKIALPGDPIRAGHTFDGWYIDPGLTEAFDFDTPITGDMTLYVKWTTKGYTVTFRDWNGQELKSEGVEYGQAATAPPEPTREGYTFTGWDVAFDQVVANLAVTAEYQINSYAVTFDSRGGSAVASQTVDHNLTATLPSPAPFRRGYRFTGWYSDRAVTTPFTFTTPIAGPITLYAGWRMNAVDDYQPKPSQTADDRRLEELIRRGQQLRLDLQNYQGHFSAGVLDALSAEELSLPLVGNGIFLEFAPGWLEFPSDSQATIEIRAERLDCEDQAARLAGARLGGGSTGLFEVCGQVFDLSLVLHQGGTAEQITQFAAPVAVTIDLSSLNLTEGEIARLTGVRLEVDEAGNLVPVELGGTYDSDSKTYTFYTDRFSLYSVMQLHRPCLVLTLIPGSHEIVINGEIRTTDVAAQVHDQRTMVPLRMVATAMGANVDWIAATRSVIVALDGQRVELTLGQLDPERGLDVPAQIIDGRTLVPLRYIAETLGATVNWHSDTNLVEIIKY